MLILEPVWVGGAVPLKDSVFIPRDRYPSPMFQFANKYGECQPINCEKYCTL